MKPSGAVSWPRPPCRCDLRAIAIGTLNLYSDEAGFFDSDQLNLLEEISGDIAYCLNAMDQERQRRKKEEELQ